MIKEVTYQYAKDNGFNRDILDAYNGAKDEGTEAKIIEATIQDLADANIGTCCGIVGNSCFREIIKKYPNWGKVELRAILYVKDNDIGWPDIKIVSKGQGYAIQRLADKGGGSLRFEDAGDTNGWWYFETE